MDFARRGRVPYFLQSALKDEIEKILAGMTFKRPNSEERIAMQVHEQALPIPGSQETVQDNETIAYVEEEAEEAVFKCPWCIVKVDKGKIDGPNANVEVVTIIEFGVFDDDPENNGHKEIENLIWKIYERFAKNPILACQYECMNDFDFAHQDEDTFPYFFGAISMTFRYAGIQRESGAEFT